jgi:hypothetical protein
MTKKDLKRAAMKHQRQLQDLIDQWDPVGLLRIGAPPDEYDCLAAPMLGRLAKSATASELSEWLTSYCKEHFGVPARGPRGFAAKAFKWYRALAG